MKARTKLLIEKYTYMFVVCFFVCAIIFVNVRRLQDNLYANYEKTVDYGRVRETKDNIEHLMTVIFYENRQERQNSIASYIEHFDQYKKQNVRMVIVPEKVDEKHEQVLERFFWEIDRHNNFDKITLVSGANDNSDKYKDLLQGVTHIKSIRKLQLTADDAANEAIIAKDLQQKKALVVFLADFAPNTENKNINFLYEEAVYFAQKNNYLISVIDTIDTGLAQALEKNYSTQLFAENPQNDRITRQKANLQAFINNYRAELFKYFMLNLQTNDKSSLWPQKTPHNYRLFDRGDVYIKILDENFAEVFSYGRVERNESVIVMLVNIAKKAARRVNLQKIKHVKLYLLTELEKIDYPKGAVLADYIDNDDGIVIRYEKFYAIMLPEDRPDESQNLVEFLRQRAGVPLDASDDDIQFYRFKTVEAEYEN